MKIIQGVQLEDEEIQSILFCLKWAQKRDAQESIFSEERRRVVSRLIREFARLTGAPVEWEAWTNVKKTNLKGI